MTSKPASDALLAQMMDLHPSEMVLGLERMERILGALDDPQARVPQAIHVAGTNGKGSAQAMIRAGLEAAGNRVHAYTSPHLVRFHERILLAGAEIAEPALVAVLSRVLTANQGQPITFFEATTATAFVAFAETPADWLLLEVGMGGRLDSTNIVENVGLTVITPVAMDHQAYLGDTLAAIAGEKAGILKRGVPVVVGPQEDEALEVIEARAGRLGAPVLAHGQHWHVWAEGGRLIFQDETGLLDLPLPRLRGAHQVQNAGTALAALRHLGADEAACEAAVTQAHWPARMQPLTGSALNAQAPQAELWLDGGHNAHAGAALASTLRDLPPKPTVLICGMQSDKDAAGYLASLAAVADRLIAVPVPTGQGHAPSHIAETAGQLGLASETAETVTAALGEAARHTPAARVLICGSLYLAGHVLSLGQEIQA